MNELIKCLARFGAVSQSMLAIAILFIFYLYINILQFVALKIVISTRPSEFGSLSGVLPPPLQAPLDVPSALRRTRPAPP